MPVSHSALRVGTFNVRWDDPVDGPRRWDKRRASVLAFLGDWKPDVLGMQEVRSGPLADLRRALGDYDSVAAGRDDGADAGEHCPVFFRRERFALEEAGTFWFSDTPDTPGSQGWGCRHPRIATWAYLRDRVDGSAFYFYSLHWDHESQAARENSARLLAERIAARRTPDPVIVAGDFNAEVPNPALAALQSPDSPVPRSALAGAFAPTSGSFHGFSGDAPGTPIDHLLLSPEWEVIDAGVVRGGPPYLSDHFPLAATLRRNG